MDDEQYIKRLTELQQKWLNKTISPEELAELNRWFYADLDGDLYIPESFASSESYFEQSVLNKIKLARKKTNSRIKHLPTWVAAASIILIIGGMAYQYFFNRTSAVNEKHDAEIVKNIQPGYDHAILKLSDGSTIALDSANDRGIHKQGDALVTQSDGQLKYTTDHSSGYSHVVYNTMFTPRGGQFKIVLADGTIAWLNSASELRFPTSFSGKERVVECKGEVFFKIAKNSSKPFRVKMEKLEVEVLGTEFNINAYENEDHVETTLINGSVNVKTDNQKLKLIPGQQARLLLSKSSYGKIQLVKNVDIEDVLSWQNGLFQFRNADLNLIARQLSRWYDVDVETKGNSNNVELGGGISKRLPLTQILKMLEKSGVQHNWNNGKLILYAI